MALITNRTYEDCERAKYLLDKVHAGGVLTTQEKDEYFSGLRGCYNMATDWVRVEGKVAELSGKLNLNLETKTNWTYKSIATREEINRYLGNISALCAAVVLPEGTPNIPTIEDWIDYRVANDIERLLEIVEDSIQAASGVIQIGDTLLIKYSVNVRKQANILMIT